MDYVYGYDEIVSDFVAQMIPACQQRGFKNCKTIGIISDVSLVAGLVYHNYNPDAGVIEISSAAIPGSRWMTRETVKRMYQYPFLQLGWGRDAIGMVLTDDTDWDEVGELMIESYCVLAPKKLVALIDRPLAADGP